MDWHIELTDTGRSIRAIVHDTPSYPLTMEVQYEKDNLRRGARDTALRFMIENIYFRLHQCLLAEDKMIRER